MDSAKILSLLEQLDDDIDDLEESLEPLVKTALTETSSKLPLLDKAKLYVLVTYAIESLLFSYLRLHGVKAREHPVFVELTRVKQYFEKIKSAETPPAERSLKVDKDAAGRFIKAGLAGNKKYDLERAEREAKERARAHIRFEEISKEIAKKKQEITVAESKTASSSKEGSQKRMAEAIEEDHVQEDPYDFSDSESDSSSDSSSDSEHESEEAPPPPPVAAPKKKRKLDRSGSGSGSGSASASAPPSAPTSGTSTPAGSAQKKRPKITKAKAAAQNGTTPKKSKSKKKSKKSKKSQA